MSEWKTAPDSVAYFQCLKRDLYFFIPLPETSARPNAFSKRLWSSDETPQSLSPVVRFSEWLELLGNILGIGGETNRFTSRGLYFSS